MCVSMQQRNSLFVCTKTHSKEHQPHMTLLPVPGPLLSSLTDPCKARQLHMTPSPPENEVPVVLNKQIKPEITIASKPKQEGTSIYSHV